MERGDHGEHAPGNPQKRPLIHQPLLQAKSWLPRLDSNQDTQIQNLVCYRYTTGQEEKLYHKLELRKFWRKRPRRARSASSIHRNRTPTSYWVAPIRAISRIQETSPLTWNVPF